MEYDALKDVLKLNIPKPHRNFEKTLNACKKTTKINYKVNNIIIAIITCLVIVLITSFTTIIIDRKVLSKQTIYGNVDMGKDPHLAINGGDSNYTPIFDTIVAWGPELASGTFEMNVIINSRLLKEEDIETLKEYERGIKAKHPSQNVSFQIALGIKDSKDYIYLIDYCGVLDDTGKDYYYQFVFESNLPYDFDSIINDFEEQIGEELSNDFLNSSYYDDQNLLCSGIIMGFSENDGVYKEYYLIKHNGKLYVDNKD